MKKIILYTILVLTAIVANATTYRVKYDVANERSTSFVVNVSYDKITINGTTYSLHRMGTITNSGFVFDSYSYGNQERMFCVATTPITVQKNTFTTFHGYMMLIDGKAYLADKIN